MTSTSATSSIVSALGGGSGIDMAALAQSLATASFAARIDRNSVRAETVERQISAASALRSSLLQLSSSIGERVRTGDLARVPTIGNAAVAIEHSDHEPDMDFDSRFQAGVASLIAAKKNRL